MEWTAAARTDTGLRRPGNEDACLIRRDLGLVVVADGMGGHAAGEVASRLAVDEVAASLERAGIATATAEDGRRALLAAFLAANRAVHEAAAANPEYRGMGTTLTAVVLRPGAREAWLAHVGDSRAYLLRRGRLVRLTRDHTWVQEQVERGHLSPREARTHPAASVLTRAVGTLPEVAVDDAVVPLAPGDVLLLCTDGLTNVVRDRAIAGVLSRGGHAGELAAELVELANRGGGPDNITAAVIRIGP